MICTPKECNEFTELENCHIDHCVSRCYPEREGYCSLNFGLVSGDDWSKEISCSSYHSPVFELDCWDKELSLDCESKACNSYTPLELCNVEHCSSRCYPDSGMNQCQLNFPRFVLEDKIVSDEYCDAFHDDFWYTDCWFPEATYCFTRACDGFTPEENCHLEKCNSKCYPKDDAVC